MRRLLVLLPLLLLAACRPAEGTEDPPLSAVETPAEAAQGSADVAGTYRLVGLDDNVLPALVGQMDECAVMLGEGTLTLDAEGAYRLALLAMAVCGDDEEPADTERVLKQGPYTLEGADIRFGDMVTEIGGDGLTADEDADPINTENELLTPDSDAMDDEPELFSPERFSGDGTVRGDEVSITLDDLSTLRFVRQ